MATDVEHIIAALNISGNATDQHCDQSPSNHNSLPVWMDKHTAAPGPAAVSLRQLALTVGDRGAHPHEALQN